MKMTSNALFLLLLALCSGAGWCEDIGSVLQRSQRERLASFGEAAPEAPGGAALRVAFERLQDRLPAAADAQLRVVETGAMAETMEGRVIVMNVALGELPEVCRLFLLAHELGHVTGGHWTDRIALYRRFIPGEVVQTQTDAVAAELGRAASEQSHRQEYEADAYAMRTLLDLGYSRDDLLEMFYRLGRYGTTATHPSSGHRLAQLRLIEEQRRTAAASVNPQARTMH